MMMTNMEICIKTAKLLKEQFPNDLMKIEDNTVIEYSTKNSRLLGGKANMNMGRAIARFYSKQKRVVIKQKFLKEPKMYSTYGSTHSLTSRAPRKQYVDLHRYLLIHGQSLISGNWALIDLMCHELAHYKTKGHAKGFKVKYHRFLDYMTNKVISGEFYHGKV